MFKPRTLELAVHADRTAEDRDAHLIVMGKCHEIRSLRRARQTDIVGTNFVWIIVNS